MISACQMVMRIGIGEAETCNICGGDKSECTPVSRLPKSYTDRNESRSKASTGVCACCMTAMSGKPPNALRMWSILWRADGKYKSNKLDFMPDDVWLGNKADMRPIVDTLISPPASAWVCGVADMGKIHTLPLSVVNSSAEWTVRFDRVNVSSTPKDFSHLLLRVSKLVAAGFSRDAILTGKPKVSELVRCGPDTWLSWSTESFAMSPVLAMALTLTKKDNVNETIRILEN